MANVFSRETIEYLSIFLFLLTTCVFFQNKAIVPKTGTIAFIKKEMVLDRDLYLNSMIALIPKLSEATEKELYLQRLSEKKSTDTIQLKLEVTKISHNLELMLPFIIDEPEKNLSFLINLTEI